MKRETVMSAGGRKPRRPRAGYTLLELLVASVLIATLMAAVWNLMTMYSTFLMAGRTQAAEQQLARSLMDLLAADLRAVVPMSGGERTTVGRFPTVSQADERLGFAPSDERSTVAVREIESRAGLSLIEETGFVDAAAQLPENSFNGDETSLTLVIVRSEPDFRTFIASEDNESPRSVEREAGLARSVDARSSDRFLPAEAAAKEWSQIIYRFEPPRMVARDDRGLMPGLHRFEVPVEYLGLLSQDDSVLDEGASGLDFAFDDEGENDLETRLERLREQGVTEITHEHIPEVVACRFEFLRNSSWGAAWGKAEGGDRPLAVRVKLKLLSSAEYAELTALLGSEAIDGGGATEPTEPVLESVGATNPFAAFRPRQYERTILIETARNIRRPDELGSPHAERPVGSSEWLVGGRP